MQASECCIIRVAIAASLGWLSAITLMWKYGALAALVVSPLFGSAAAIAALVLFWFVSLFVSCDPAAARVTGVDR